MPSPMKDLILKLDEFSPIWTGVGLLAIVIVVILWIRTGAIAVHTRMRRKQLSPAYVDKIRAKEDTLDDFSDVGIWVVPMTFVAAVLLAMLGSIPFAITVWFDEVIAFGDFSSGLEVTATIAAIVATVSAIAGTLVAAFFFGLWAIRFGCETRLTADEYRAAQERDRARYEQEQAEKRRREEEARLAARRAARRGLFRRRRRAGAA